MGPIALQAAALLLFAGCSAPATPATSAAPQGERVQRVVAVMGTSLTLEVYAPSRTQALEVSEAALRAIEVAEERLSTWRPSSELSRLNAHAGQGPRPVSDTLGQELRSAHGWAAKTGGAFDLTVGPLVEAFDLRGAGRWPQPSQLAAALEQVGYPRMEFAESAIVLAPATTLEEGAFGKGAALDAASSTILDAGAHGTLSLGGQVKRVGGTGTQSQPIAHPDQRSTAVLSIDLGPNESMATSACGVRPLEANGSPLGHILDPRTGLPATDFGSVTVLTTSALAADALSTAAFVLGPQAALAAAVNWDGAELLVLERAGERLNLTYTPGLQGRVHRLSPSVSLSPLNGPKRSAVTLP